MSDSESRLFRVYVGATALSPLGCGSDGFALAVARTVSDRGGAEKTPLEQELPSGARYWETKRIERLPELPAVFALSQTIRGLSPALWTHCREPSARCGKKCPA